MALLFVHDLIIIGACRIVHVSHFFPFQSGAIMAVLGAVCYYYPDTQLNIAFVGDIIPHSFSASSVSTVGKNYALVT